MLTPLALVLVVAPAAQALDHSPWQGVLSAHVSPSGRVDYAAIKDSGAVDAYLQSLATANEPSGSADKVAFWINAYNALTVDLVADNWPLSSIRDIDGGTVWDTRSFTVAGQQLTLNDIEHRRIRPIADGRIHAAVSCASEGCPPLSRTAFLGASLESQLDAVARGWASTNAVVIDRSAGTAKFNQIFDWYGDDFVVDGDADPAGVEGKLAEAANWVASYSSDDTAAWLRAGGYRADWSSYSWSVNSQ